MEYGVPGDIDLADLDDIESPREIIYAIVEWIPVEEVHESTDEGGEEKQRMIELWFPAAMAPCNGGGWHAPAATYFGPMHVFDSYKKALVRATRIIGKLNKERVELSRGLEDLTSGAAAVVEEL